MLIDISKTLTLTTFIEKKHTPMDVLEGDKGGEGMITRYDDLM